MSLLLLFAGGSATQPSGGWRRASRRPGHWPREETETEREARILADRIRLGIIVPEAAPPTRAEAHSEPVGAALLGSPTTAEATELRRLARLRAQAEALSDGNAALDLAGLRTAEYLDAEIERHLAVLDDEARRRHRLRQEEIEWILFFQ